MSQSDEFQKLCRKRDILKIRLNQFVQHVQGLPKVDSEITQVIVIELKERLSIVEYLMDDFKEVQGEIEDIIELTNLKDEVEARGNFESVLLKHKAIAKSITSKEFQSCSDTQSQHSCHSVHSDHSVHSEPSERSVHANSSVLNRIKLPTIQLPNFDGRFDTWLEYRDTFESLIHQNESINSIQKFHYLRASLSGDAAQVIRSLEFSANNYTVAWGLLQDRFNNARLLVHNHLKALFNIEKINKESSARFRSLIDTISKHLRALNSLGQLTDQWDTLIIFIIASKLDSHTERKWEEYKVNQAIPTLEDLKQFLTARADLLETTESSQGSQGVKRVSKFTSNTKTFLTSNKVCAFCKGDHFIYTCPEFLKSSVNDRIECAKRGKLCLNCLGSGHMSKDCKSGNCRKCKGQHNTLLHFESRKLSPRPEATNESLSTLSSATLTAVSQATLLPTANVFILDQSGKSVPIRALLDSASQSSYITQELCKSLSLSTSNVDISVSGINNVRSRIESQCDITVKARLNSFTLNLSCLVIPQITSEMPNFQVDINHIQIPKNITLADPNFYKPDKIDLLIGGQHFWNLMCIGQITLGPNQPILQKTRLGWVVAGTVISIPTSTTMCHFTEVDKVQDSLCRFWEIEQCPTVKPLSEEEKLCESHFNNTTTRDSQGRFIVTIPLKSSPEALGESFEQAKKRFYKLEKRLDFNAEFKKSYSEFIEEYEQLGHMSLASNRDSSQHQYYMPHHGILKESSVTTKLRVVFDASAPSSTGVSFNDIQLVGPTIQRDLFSIILSFRTHKFALSADIAKMYRQVLVSDSQRSLQRILWRSDPSGPLKTFDMNTVTYGTASASFLSTRCLMQLALDCEQTMPQISDIIKNSFYVDDLLTGADTIAEAIQIRNDISNVLNSGCFELRKWISNDPQMLQGLNPSDSPHNILDLGVNENTKTLGLLWCCSSDSFLYNINSGGLHDSVTKRSMLSTVSQIFDPLGLVSPCIIIAKVLLQRLWLERLSWDEALPMHLHSEWVKFQSQLCHLNALKINRRILCDFPVIIDLHGFSDASEKAYGACVYARSVDISGNVQVHLICSKTRVTPIKTLSIPRLELCAAQMLATLMEKVSKELGKPINQHVFWTDSTVVLAWLKTSPNMLKIFVGNRVASILDSQIQGKWLHVPTKHNPADLLSRGLYPEQLINNKLWWHGPAYLSKSPNHWPIQSNSSSYMQVPELKQQATQSYPTVIKNDLIPLNTFSRLSTLCRIIAWCLRFINNINVPKIDRKSGPLRSSEIQNAELAIAKIVQREMYSEEISALAHNKPLDKSSQLLSLNPFLDEGGVLRVGGRLAHSAFPYNKRHPILLAPKHIFTILLFREEHLRLLHAGPQLLLSSLRNRYWSIAGLNLAKKTVRECVTCARAKPRNLHPIMSNLPKERVNPSFPFQFTGVDYAGALLIKDKRGRGAKNSKCYVSLFVCMATKAIHLELVSSLTTESFVLALRRFASRRGMPSKLFSDNGTNFIGAHNELNELGKFLKSNHSKILERSAQEHFSWHFIPSHSPHFGGLWEAGVKSVKHHLKRVAGQASLTFEEMSSLLVQIEAIVNSRPLTPLSSNPYDLSPLTPAHFLVGRPLVAVPDPGVAHIPEARLSVFQYIQKLSQHFWKRWSAEYIPELQRRVKWKTKDSQCVKLGDLVLIKDDNLPPMKWLLGRVTSLHPGSDSICRVVSVKTTKGITKRAVSRICPLPIDTDHQDSSVNVHFIL